MKQSERSTGKPAVRRAREGRSKSGMCGDCRHVGGCHFGRPSLKLPCTEPRPSCFAWSISRSKGKVEGRVDNRTSLLPRRVGVTLSGGMQEEATLTGTTLDALQRAQDATWLPSKHSGWRASESVQLELDQRSSPHDNAHKY